MKKLSDVEVRERLQKLKDWNWVAGRIEKTFVFPDFARAVVFVNRAVNPIEEMQHHPHIAIAYNRVTVSITTFDVGGLTELDFDLAGGIDQLV